MSVMRWIAVIANGIIGLIFLVLILIDWLQSSKVERVFTLLASVLFFAIVLHLVGVIQ